MHKRVRRLAMRFGDAEVAAALGDPVFIVSAPRSGSTLLFSLLGNSPDIWTIGGESHVIFQQFPKLKAADDAFSSGALGAGHADAATAAQIRRFYLASLCNVRGETTYDRITSGSPKEGVFVEKTPRNALNIPFLLGIFPTARFIFLHRDPRANIASIIEGWQTGIRTGQFVTYRDLPGRPGPWCFLLPPGWQAHAQAPLAEIAAFQWRAANEAILDTLPTGRWISLAYEDLIADPRTQLRRLCDFCVVATGPALDQVAHLPLSASTISAPSPDKWRRFEHEVLDQEAEYRPAEVRLLGLPGASRGPCPS
ncbi:sulfotransferase [Asticcacaulis sp. 201]|uniref:sulfotransferase family protein n=1 Tax=Asticcacaulis sp. 201 TaxID=3028787 RepID=UPI002916773A|nr:sulfotransferase [Asticcacaulis sp. 201]MDV6331134.1 sulfotransferase [Asticcacaulis sp. 201]